MADWDPFRDNVNMVTDPIDALIESQGGELESVYSKYSCDDSHSDEESLTNKITQEKFADQNLLKDFLCLICLDLPEKIFVCKDCSGVFHKTCISIWEKNRRRRLCPLCKTQKFKLVPLENCSAKWNEFLKLELKCSVPQCQQSHTVESYKNHQDNFQHHKIPIKCNHEKPFIIPGFDLIMEETPTISITDEPKVEDANQQCQRKTPKPIVIPGLDLINSEQSYDHNSDDSPERPTKNEMAPEIIYISSSDESSDESDLPPNTLENVITL